MNMSVIFLLLGSGVFTSLTVVAGCEKFTFSGEASDDPCGITGTWINELSSVVKFNCSSDGSLTGRYYSAVGVAEDFYQVSGRYTNVGPGLADAIVGWSVAWNNHVKGNSNSTTSWTGVHYKTERKIYTTWILTSFTSRAEMWSNSLVGSNVFSKMKD